MEEDTEAPAAPRPSAAKPRSASPGRALLGRLQKRSLEPSPLARAAVEDETRPAPAIARPAAKTSGAKAGAKASSAGSAAGDHNTPLIGSVYVDNRSPLLTSCPLIEPAKKTLRENGEAKMVKPAAQKGEVCHIKLLFILVLRPTTRPYLPPAQPLPPPRPRPRQLLLSVTADCSPRPRLTAAPSCRPPPPPRLQEEASLCLRPPTELEGRLQPAARPRPRPAGARCRRQHPPGKLIKK